MSGAESVGATEEQLDAQITVGHAAVFAGEVEAGMAQMRAVIAGRAPWVPAGTGSRAARSSISPTSW